MVLSFPVVRDFVAQALANRIRSSFPKADRIAGIATAGIAHGALAADRGMLRQLRQRGLDKKIASLARASREKTYLP